jgi:hypothetical protein
MTMTLTMTMTPCFSQSTERAFSRPHILARPLPARG